MSRSSGQLKTVGTARKRRSPASGFRAFPIVGGTAVQPTSQFVAKHEPAEGLARPVPLLAEGEATDTVALTPLPTRYAATARFSTFGMGVGERPHLVNDVARRPN